MILKALCDYYQSLVASDSPDVPPVGWSVGKVSYALALDGDGRLISLLPLKTEATRGKKTIELPQRMVVPFQYEKGAGFNPNFLCDNACFLLGLDDRGKPERALKAFEATRSLHLALLSEASGRVAQAVRSFFARWEPAHCGANDVLSPWLESLPGGNLVFRVEGQYAHEDPELISIWQAEYDRPEETDICMPDLITGECMPIARTHPMIWRIRDAPTTGSKLVGFNEAAYESYGKTQSYNAPVSKRLAFEYATALNLLLADEQHVKYLGDTTIVYWAQNAEESYQYAFGQAMEPAEALDDKLLDEVLAATVRGRLSDIEGLRMDMPFYILGLAPNAARVAVRFFLQGSFGSFLENLAGHYRRLEIVQPGFDHEQYLSISSLIWETINKKSKKKAADSRMAAQLLSAALQNTLYPASLSRSVLLRINAEHQVTRGQAALLKAWLLQNCRWEQRYDQIKEVATVELNESCTYLPYVLGRLFAVLESIQEAAAETKLNSTIKDHFFSSACATPAPIFQQLFRLVGFHMRKLRREKPGLAVNMDKLMGGLMATITQPIPSHLLHVDQCTFNLGYYHQRQAFFKSKKEEPDHA